MAANEQQTIRLRDFGIVPDTGEDCTAAIQAVLAELSGRSDIRLVFERGRYTFADEQSQQEYDRLMSGELHPNTFWGKPELPYHSAMSFRDMNGLEIDGQGAVFVFHGLVQPFELSRCTQVVLKHFTLDWDRPLFSNGVLLSYVDGTGLIEIDAGYPLSGGEPVWSVMAYDRDTQRFGRASCFPEDAKLTHVSDNIYACTTAGLSRFRPGSGLNLRHTHNYRPGIYIADSAHVMVQNVTIHAAAGMGIIGFHSEHLSFDHLEVRPRGSRLMSTNTDATHFISCAGEIRFTDCYFEGMGDDAANVHGFYLSTVRVEDSRTLQVTIDTSDITQNRLFDGPMVGDVLEFVRGEDLSPYATNRTIACTVDEAGWTARLELENDLPAEFRVTDLIANGTRTAKLVFRDCTVTNNRARGLLVQTRGALIENNRFDSCTGTGIHVNAAANWKECTGTRDVIIRGNTFRKCGFGDGTIKGASAIAITTECAATAVGIHRHFLLENNTIQGLGQSGILISAAAEGVVMGNTFDNCAPAIQVEHASDIVIVDNLEVGEERAVADVAIGEACEGIKLQ